MPNQSTNFLQALDGIRDAILGADPSKVDFGYPQLANGPIEVVLGFNNNETIKLVDATTKAPYFSSHGELTDLQRRVLPDSRVETTFPVDPTKLGDAFLWPNKQEPNKEGRFDSPPLDEKNTTGHGYSKQAYFFGGNDSLVTVGPSLPKIALAAGGGAQFWVGSIGVVTQGTGKYEGARGESVYLGSAYLPNWPKAFPDQAALLAKGFTALVSTYFKLVLRGDLE